MTLCSVLLSVKCFHLTYEQHNSELSALLKVTAAALFDRCETLSDFSNIHPPGLKNLPQLSKIAVFIFFIFSLLCKLYPSLLCLAWPCIRRALLLLIVVHLRPLSSAGQQNLKTACLSYHMGEPAEDSFSGLGCCLSCLISDIMDIFKVLNHSKTYIFFYFLTPA